MKQIVLSMLIVLGLFLKPAEAQKGVEPEDVIAGQIEAFKADDFEKAFEFASPNIQGMFRTPENFGAMVRNGYPMVWRPGRVEFLEAREIAGRLWQKVLITDEKGALHLLDYQMVEGEDGWRINAVQVLEAPELTA